MSPDPPAPPPPPPPRFVAANARALALALAPLALLAVLASVLRLPPRAAIGTAFLASVTAIVAAAAAMPYVAARASRVRTALTIAVGASLMLVGFALARDARGAPPLDTVAGLCGSAGVLLAATTLGGAVGIRIIDPAHLLAVALASSAADLWSAFAPEGITRAVAASPDMALQRLLAVSATVPPSRSPDAMIGLGDVIFAGLYTAASLRHGLSRARTLGALAAGLALTGALTFVFLRALPALPLMGAAVVLAQPRTRAVARHDRAATWLAAGLVLAAIVRIIARRL